MFEVSDKELARCGYKYNSSINPAFIPGKYMHLNVSRTAFEKDGLLQIPASVTPYSRIPMFWLSLHTYPLSTYKIFANQILKHDGYFMTYFHPWEFVDHPNNIKKYMLPIVNHNNGTNMCKRLDKLIKYFKEQGRHFATFETFMLSYKQEKGM